MLTGTVFYGSKIPVRTCNFVLFEMCASKNGVAAQTRLERRHASRAEGAHCCADAMSTSAQICSSSATTILRSNTVSA